MTDTEFIYIYPKNPNAILCPDGINFYVVYSDRLQYDTYILSFDDELKNEYTRTWIDGMEAGIDGVQTENNETWIDDEQFVDFTILS